jgi:hypothetical protein
MPGEKAGLLRGLLERAGVLAISYAETTNWQSSATFSAPSLWAKRSSRYFELAAADGGGVSARRGASFRETRLNRLANGFSAGFASANAHRVFE